MTASESAGPGDSAGSPLLRMEQVSKHFPGVLALHDVSLEVYPGEVLGLVGENGAGKSTLMKILSGVYQPDGGQIIELQGTVGASPAIDRSAGFNSVLEGNDAYEIVFQQTAEFKRDVGLTVTEQALQANPDVDAIVAANDDMAFGAAEAVSGAGLDIPIIGFDALPEALQAVQDGTLAATVEQFPGGQTGGAMDILVNFLRDGTEPAEHDNFIEPALITADNLGEAERVEEAGIEVAAPEATPMA
jgi:ABC-type sugar transport system substrate-binding protein